MTMLQCSDQLITKDSDFKRYVFISLDLCNENEKLIIMIKEVKIWLEFESGRRPRPDFRRVCSSGSWKSSSSGRLIRLETSCRLPLRVSDIRILSILLLTYLQVINDTDDRNWRGQLITSVDERTKPFPFLWRPSHSHQVVTSGIRIMLNPK